jgi:chromosome segregation ATPase
LKKNRNKISNLEKEVEQLKEKMQETKEEKAAINDLFYNLQKELEEEDEKDVAKLTEEDRKKIVKKRGIFVSPREGMQKRLKRRLPNFEFIDADEMNFDTSVLGKYHYIFYNSKFGSHSLYKKVKSSLNDSQKIHHINRTNIDTIVKEIDSKLA